MSDMPSPASSGEEFPPEQILIGRKAAWILTSFFILLLAVPPLLDDPQGRARELGAAINGRGSQKKIADRLRAFDASVASASFTGAPRQLTQQALTSLLRKGNDRVLVGKDGWLFYRPEIQALTGYGPLDPEPHSVSRDPALLDWEAPLGPIIEFSRQLGQRCQPELATFRPILMLVPVPMKPSIYPEKLTGKASAFPVAHRDRHHFYNALREAGIKVLDLMPQFWEAKKEDTFLGPLYLPDDTHWTSRGMEIGAGLISQEIIQRTPGGLYNSANWGSRAILRINSRPAHGDLTEKLGLRFPHSWQPPRTEPLLVVDSASGSGALVDKNSPLVLLGDSFVNIFDDPGLGFAPEEGNSQTRGGLAAHLAARLGIPLDVHAVNGEGASGVRRWLAQRGDSVLRTKKLVIWVIAERDLFLSRSIAKANQVNWDRVVFTDSSAEPQESAAVMAGPVIVEAELLEKSEQADPRRANYENALYTAQYRILKTMSGTPVSGDVEVVHWDFKKRALQPTANLEVGRVYRLTLQPWAAQQDLQPINRGELGDAPPKWWSAAAEPVR